MEVVVVCLFNKKPVRIKEKLFSVVLWMKYGAVCPCLSQTAWQNKGVMENLSGNWCVYLKPSPSNTELRGRPAVSTLCFHTECQTNNGGKWPSMVLRLDYRAAQMVPSWHLAKHLQEHIVLTTKKQICSFTEAVFYICFNAVLYIQECTLVEEERGR